MTILDKIVKARKERLDKLIKVFPYNSLNRIDNAPIPFFQSSENVTLIAECKKGSPSKGIMVKDYFPQEIAPLYEEGGATALSVLTEPDFFFGATEDLINVKKNVSLPIIRKDFIIDPYQVKEAWAMGADAILLIAAILSTEQMKELNTAAHEFGLQTLLEVHNREEFDKSVEVDADGFGINARNLKDFSIDLEAVKDICSMLPKDKIAVAESGLMSPDAGKEMYDTGFRGFLVGEYFVTAKDKVKTVREFKEALK